MTRLDSDLPSIMKNRCGGRPSREQAGMRQQLMLDMAERAFLRLGYSGASLDNIARDAGVAKKTLYEHFGDKAGLFAAVVDRLRKVWVDGVRNIMIEAPDPCVALYGVALHLLDVGTRDDMIEWHRLTVNEARRFPEIFNSVYDERGVCVDMMVLSNYLRTAVENGVLEFDDVELAAEQFSFMVLGGIRTRILRGVSVRPDIKTREHMAKQAVQTFLKGSVSQSAVKSWKCS
ncbi:MAG TPA: TetR/AcrR family transcriptional regulator [Rhodocyclaceae bacterium]|jgi:AcrR family transcriptional regulator|nr:TetR/AcrR family transcriptional regulator [Rhodocyclaceae bacterium]